MTREVGRSSDVRVRIGRLVVDRSALANTSAHALHESVVERITQQLEITERGGPTRDLSDAIATEVAAHVSPRVSFARRR